MGRGENSDGARTIAGKELLYGRRGAGAGPAVSPVASYAELCERAGAFEGWHEFRRLDEQALELGAENAEKQRFELLSLCREGDGWMLRYELRSGADHSLAGLRFERRELEQFVVAARRQDDIVLGLSPNHETSFGIFERVLDPAGRGRTLRVSRDSVRRINGAPSREQQMRIEEEQFQLLREWARLQLRAA